MTGQDEAWLEWRRQGIGASDMAKAATGKYGGIMSVVAEKLGIEHSPIDPKLADRGHRWEQRIADAVHAITGYYVHGEQMLMEHPTDKRWRWTADGLIDQRPNVASIEEFDTGLELKTKGLRVVAPWDFYVYQTRWAMKVAGFSRMLIAVATIDDDALDEDDEFKGLQVSWVERDEFEEERLTDLAEQIWAYVEAGELPEPEDAAALEIVMAANADADADADPVDLDPIAEVVAERHDLKARHKAAGDELKLMDAKIRSALGEAIHGATSDGKWRVRCGEPVRKFTGKAADAALLVWPEYGKTVLDVERFRAEQPDEYEEFKLSTPDRRLTIKENTKS